MAVVKPTFVMAVKDFQKRHLHWCEVLAITKDWAVDISIGSFGYVQDALAAVYSDKEFRVFIKFNTDFNWDKQPMVLDTKRVKEEALKVVMGSKFKELGASYLDDDQWNRIVQAGVEEYRYRHNKGRRFDLKDFEEYITKTYNLGPNAGVLHPGGIVDEEAFDKMVEAAGGEDVLIAKLEAKRLEK